MKTITYRNHGLRITDVWFPDNSWKFIRPDIHRIHSIEDATGISKECMSLQHALVTYLRQREEELRNGITSKNFKYKIRRSEKDGVEARYYTRTDLKSEDALLIEFKQCYDMMLGDKGKKATLNLNALCRYILADAMTMSVGYYNNQPIVFHSYVQSADSVRFFHSCSTFREEKDLAQLIGRANKELHWEDWLHFKDVEIRFYNWVGVFPLDSEDGIDKFMRTFGWKPTDNFNVDMPISAFSELAKKLWEGKDSSCEILTFDNDEKSITPCWEVAA